MSHFKTMKRLLLMVIIMTIFVLIQLSYNINMETRGKIAKLQSYYLESGHYVIANKAQNNEFSVTHFIIGSKEDVIHYQRNTTIVNDSATRVSRYTYNIMNEDACGRRGQVDYIFYVYSAAHEFFRRKQIRNTWAQDVLQESLAFTVVFFLGIPNHNRTQARILAEHVQHGDIVQGKFEESYANLVVKGSMALHWITTFCSNAVHAVKLDDDIFFDIIKFINLLRENPDADKICAVMDDRSVLKYTGNDSFCLTMNAMWCVNTSYHFPQDKYPTYCLGATYTLSLPVLQSLAHYAPTTPLFYIEDIYFTGILFALATTKYSFNKTFDIFDNITFEQVPFMNAMINKHKRDSKFLAIYNHLPDEFTMLDFWNVTKNTTEYVKILEH